MRKIILYLFLDSRLCLNLAMDTKDLCLPVESTLVASYRMILLEWIAMTLFCKV